MQKLLSKAHQAIQEFNMIEENDKIAVGLSGGKDSLILLHILQSYQRFSPKKFDLIAITLKTEGVDTTLLHKLCNDFQISYHEVETNLNEIIFDTRKEKNACSLYEDLRITNLNDIAKKLGCNKIALGHNKDDAIETFLMYMLYEGKASCFSPKYNMNEQDLTIIRPMIYIDEYLTKKVARDYNYPIIENSCLTCVNTNKQNIKELIAQLNHEIPNSKENLFRSLSNSDKLFIWDKEKIK
ncbi:tRNA 2-thiocytidine biosynthesis TtcA family protein [Terrisporobacter sp.]